MQIAVDKSCGITANDFQAQSIIHESDCNAHIVYFLRDESGALVVTIDFFAIGNDFQQLDEQDTVGKLMQIGN